MMKNQSRFVLVAATDFRGEVTAVVDVDATGPPGEIPPMIVKRVEYRLREQKMEDHQMIVLEFRPDGELILFKIRRGYRIVETDPEFERMFYK